MAVVVVVRVVMGVAARLGPRLVVAVMVVAPQQDLLQHEEREQPQQEEAGDAAVVLGLLEEMGQQVEEHRAQQRTDRVAHHRGDPARPDAEGDQRGDGEREDGAAEAGRQDVGEGHGRIMGTTR
jgi:hypothetical protein